MVGHALASKLVELGHEVMMGSRQAGNEKAVAWAKAAGERASEGSFADAAEFGEVVINATAGMASLAALTAAGADNLAGKVLIEVANPLDSSKGMPPVLSVCNTDSLGEQVQRFFPDARVVKAFNTVNAQVMVNPGLHAEPHTILLCGNDEAAKAQVRELAISFGWPTENVLDLGDIAGARGMEMYVVLWLRLAGATGTWQVNVKVVTR
jgi:8-hydroxy-5-deazaflavin:NADPH oxidoreductase